jgi:hypothetical protein
MKILFINFSDTHFTKNNNPVLLRIDKIFDAIKNIETEIRTIVILITGDISFSGKSDEFFNAMTFLEDIKERLSRYCNCEVVVIPAPGNHDCDFNDEEKNLRKISVEDVYKNEELNLDSHQISFLCSPQKNFFDFRNSIQPIKYLKYDNKIVYQYDIDLSTEINVKINCYNTSWLSLIKEQQGKLYFPMTFLPQESDQNRSNLTISLLHHPYNWFNETNARRFREYLDKNSDIIITGHEHINDQYIRLGQDGNFTNYIESDSLQGNDNQSGFNIVVVDIQEGKQKIINYSWNKSIYAPKISSDWIKYRQFDKIRKHKFQLKEIFKDFLNDIGINLTHPFVSKPTLDDLYVYPTVLDLNFESGDITTKNYLLTENLFTFNTPAQSKIFLVGADGSGKTGFCKQIFKQFYHSPLLPIYLEGKKINSTAIGDSVKEIENAFCDEYDCSKIEDFRQIDRAKILIIIDDFHGIKLNNKYKTIFISNLIKLYPNILSTVNNYFLIEEILSKKEKQSIVYEEFLKFQITEFGHVNRNRLIFKWINLGCYDKIDENELQHKIYSSEKIINTIVGKSFIPAYPIFLLTMLQTIEAGTPLGTHTSQYGYYYQFLISQALIKTIEHSEIDFYDNYLSEYAFFLFDNDLRELPIIEISKFHAFYCKKYSIEKNLSKILENLVKTELFYLIDGVYWIKYNYIFYYYAAKYLSNNLTKDGIKQTVIAISRRIYREEFANIMLFLTHLSKDPFILDLLITNASEIFSTILPIKFEDDTKAISSLIESLPKEIIESKSSEEAHDEILKMQDELEQLESDESKISKNQISPLKQCLYEDTRVIDIIAKLNYAFKTIEILGQIAKKYYASIDGDTKYKLTLETYNIGLRAINTFVSEIESDPQILLKELQRTIENKNVNMEKLEKISTNLVVGISLLVSYGFIEKVASSIGSEDLSQTYDKILSDNPTNSIRLIDIAIKLDYFKGNPINYIKSMLPDLRKNQLAYILLRQFVVRYLYMFKIGIEQKSQFCDLLDITIKQQRGIEAKSKDVKK